MLIYYCIKISMILHWAFGSSNYFDFFAVFWKLIQPLIDMFNAWLFPQNMAISFWHPLHLTLSALICMIPISIYVNLVFGDSKTNKRKAARRLERKQGKRPILIGPHYDTDEDREEGG